MANGTINAFADYMLDGWFDWAGSAPPGAFNLAANGGVLTYNATGGQYDPNGLSAARQALVVAAFDMLETMTGINFEASGSEGADFHFTDTQTSAQTFWLNSGGTISRSVVNLPATYQGSTGGDVGDYIYYTTVHEIMHGLGLGHTGPYNFTLTPPVFDNDSWHVSAMSYYSQGATDSATYATPLGPMTADFAALDDLYRSQGVMDSAYLGNTLWGDSGTSGIYDGGLTDLLVAGNTFCIKDDGGIDTISVYSNGANNTIDLTVVGRTDVVGLGSSVGGQVGNLTLAAGTTIENATTGSGDDELIGNGQGNILKSDGGSDTINAKSGDDRLIGGTGADILKAGGGDDVFVFQSVAECTGDTIRSSGSVIAFEGAGAAAGDLIDFLALGNLNWGGTDQGSISVVNNGEYSRIRVNTDSDTNFEIKFDIYDAGVMASAYTAADFMFV